MASLFLEKAIQTNDPIDVHFSYFDEKGESISNECFQFHQRIFEILETVDIETQKLEYEKIKKYLGIQDKTKEDVEKIIVRVRKARIESLQKEIEQFRNKVLQVFPQSKDQSQIFNAFNLALNVHIDEKDRLEGVPYFGHVLEVAWNLLDTYKQENPDIIISALLHDTVENNAFKFVGDKNVELLQSPKNIDLLEDAAFQKIRNIFSEPISKNIAILSKPNFERMIEAQKKIGRKKKELQLKTEYYKKYMENVSRNPKALAVKYVDFEVNALEIIERFPENTEFARKKKIRQMKKYYGAFPVLQKSIQDIQDEKHPLWNHKDQLSKKIEQAKRQYEIYFQKKEIDPSTF